MFAKDIAMAISAAREVAVRQHIKANNAERVGEFKTQLRRYVGTDRNFRMSVDLNNRSLADRVYKFCMSGAAWTDIGILENYDTVKYIVDETTYEFVHDALVQAEAYLPKVDITQHGFKDLKADMACMTQSLNKMNRINDGADIIIEKIAELVAQ